MKIKLKLTGRFLNVEQEVNLKIAGEILKLLEKERPVIVDIRDLLAKDQPKSE